jgi:hypothetical protein
MGLMRGELHAPLAQSRKLLTWTALGMLSYRTVVQCGLCIQSIPLQDQVLAGATGRDFKLKFGPDRGFDQARFRPAPGRPGASGGFYFAASKHAQPEAPRSNALWLLWKAGSSGRPRTLGIGRHLAHARARGFWSHFAARPAATQIAPSK